MAGECHEDSAKSEKMNEFQISYDVPEKHSVGGRSESFAKYHVHRKGLALAMCTNRYLDCIHYRTVCSMARL